MDLTDEQVQDGLAFARLIEDTRAWPALERLVKQLHDDAIKEWESDQTGELSKKWLRGARGMASALLPAIVQRAQDAQAQIVANREAEEVVRSRSEEGLGSGDLAIA